MKALRARLATGPVLVMDGPTGTELARLGVDTTTPLWSALALLERPDLVAKVHASYARAGAQLHTTATFRADGPAFARTGRSEPDRRRAVDAAVEAARRGAEAASHDQWVLGGIGPVGDCYAPDEVPPDDVLRETHAASAAALVDAGVDGLLFETVNTMREGVVCATTGRAFGVPTLVSFVLTVGGRLLSGESLVEAAAAVRRAGADVVLVNCSSLAATQAALPVLASSAPSWGVYANGSTADPRKGWTSGDDVGAAAFVAAAHDWLRAGARIVGSCCGTGPDHTARLRALVDGAAVAE